MALTKTALGMVPPAAKMPLSRRRRPVPCCFLALSLGPGRTSLSFALCTSHSQSRPNSSRVLCGGGDSGAAFLIWITVPCFVTRVAVADGCKCSSRRRGVRVSPGLVPCALRRLFSKGCHGPLEWEMRNAKCELENGPCVHFGLAKLSCHFSCRRRTLGHAKKRGVARGQVP
ncbi:hypothetical protein B0T22DRAFT_31362 [Podospora appendiculata]|uniref:Uncharacterized protein n=1 Tax=Podospora appendiculata TaxID=314037 RepID=A0AAE0XH78_9PEZI|nr:hypothetical protein B0T22DRAFT_31362 [Podospora appendiculata]